MWYCMVSKYYSKHLKELGIADRIETYIQSTTLNKILITFKWCIREETDNRNRKDGLPNYFFFKVRY